LTVIHKDTDQFILANVTNGTYTVIASSGIWWKHIKNLENQ
jgi:hypothetical protein